VAIILVAKSQENDDRYKRQITDERISEPEPEPPIETRKIKPASPQLPRPPPRPMAPPPPPPPRSH